MIGLPVLGQCRDDLVAEGGEGLGPDDVQLERDGDAAEAGDLVGDLVRGR